MCNEFQHPVMWYSKIRNKYKNCCLFVNKLYILCILYIIQIHNIYTFWFLVSTFFCHSNLQVLKLFRSWPFVYHVATLFLIGLFSFLLLVFIPLFVCIFRILPCAKHSCTNRAVFLLQEMFGSCSSIYNSC